MSDLDNRARRANGDIFGSHATMERVKPDGTTVHYNSRLGDYPY